MFVLKIRHIYGIRDVLFSGCPAFYLKALELFLHDLRSCVSHPPHAARKTTQWNFRVAIGCDVRKEGN